MGGDDACELLSLKSEFLDFIFLFFKNLFIYFWLCWVFIAAGGLSLVAASGGCSSLRCTQGLLIAVASLVVEHGL